MAYEAKIAALERKVGQLTMELELLKNRLPCTNRRHADIPVTAIDSARAWPAHFVTETTTRPNTVFCERMGGPRWLVGCGRVHRDARGNAAVMRGVVIDVTERRRIELEAAERRNELAHLSRVAMLGELSASLAHEINQPLTAILNNAQAAQRFLAGDPVSINEVRDCLADIVEADKRAAEVIRRLRSFLKKEAVRHEQLDLNEVITDVLRLMRSDLLNRNIVVTHQLAPCLSEVAGDRVQVQQVLLNLIMNACDAMEAVTDQYRRLLVTTVQVEASGVQVTVDDKGKGIPPDRLERVFDPFVTTKTHGLGLGLSVCRSIESAHGGRIWATNNNDLGTSFHFILPVRGG